MKLAKYLAVVALLYFFAQLSSVDAAKNKTSTSKESKSSTKKEIKVNQNEATVKFHELVNATIKNERIRLRMIRLVEVHLPKMNNDTKKAARVANLIVGKAEKKGKERLGFLAPVIGSAIGGLINPLITTISNLAGGGGSDKASPQLDCTSECTCKKRDVCVRPKCPSLPRLGMCAYKPECHPLCRLEVRVPTVYEATTTTAKPDTPTKSANATTPAPAPETTTKKPSEETKKNKSKGKKKSKKCKSKSCRRRRRRMRLWKRLFKKVRSQSSKPVGLVYLEKNIKSLPINESLQQEVLDFFGKVKNDFKVTDEMIQDISEVMEYFGDKHIDFERLKKKGSERSSGEKTSVTSLFGDFASGFAGGLGSSLANAAVNGAVSAIGSLVEKGKEHKIHESCKCPEVDCRPLDIYACEGDCENNPGCERYSCVCKNL